MLLYHVYAPANLHCTLFATHLWAFNCGKCAFLRLIAFHTPRKWFFILYLLFRLFSLLFRRRHLLLFLTDFPGNLITVSLTKHKSVMKREKNWKRCNHLWLINFYGSYLVFFFFRLWNNISVCTCLAWKSFQMIYCHNWVNWSLSLDFRVNKPIIAFIFYTILLLLFDVRYIWFIFIYFFKLPRNELS